MSSAPPIDGVHWVESALPEDDVSSFDDVTWTGTHFVAVSRSSGDVIFTSTDGISWSSETTGTGVWPVSVVGDDREISSSPAAVSRSSAARSRWTGRSGDRVAPDRQELCRCGEKARVAAAQFRSDLESVQRAFLWLRAPEEDAPLAIIVGPERSAVVGGRNSKSVKDWHRVVRVRTSPVPAGSVGWAESDSNMWDFIAVGGREFLIPNS